MRRPFALIVASFLLFASDLARGEEAPAIPSPAFLDGADAAATDAEPRSDQFWYLILGVANEWPRFKESDREIDRDINRRFGAVLPRWNEPDTFSDWRDEGKLWDFQIGLGRSLSKRWAAFGVVGGITGKVRTRNGYFPLGLPIHVNTMFERKIWFLATGVDYYPWGKAELPDKSARRNPVARRLFAARPYVEAATGYLNVYAVGQVKIELPLVDSIAKIKHAEYYDLFYVSPRVGVDIPLTENNQVSFMTGYLFYDRHPDEFNGASFFITLKHRF